MFKEINRKILIITILVLVEFNLIYCMKTTNFCRIKQVKEEEDIPKCFGKFRFDCGHFCSKNLTECNEYKQLNSNVKILIGLEPSFHTMIRNNQLVDKLETFNKHIKICHPTNINNIYELNKNDFCLTGSNCYEKIITPWGFGYNYIKKKIDCKCPIEQSFQCGKYCTSDSIACDFAKSNTLFVITNIIINNNNKCNNDNLSIIRPFF
jgi:hypothetical protein